MTGGNARIRAVFSGRVQGVFFRANTKRFSDENGIAGWVRNTEDGNVEALFEGDRGDIAAVIVRCEHEQPYARVSSVDISEEAYIGDLDGFRIRH
jgi:acylphosphatase